MLIVKLNYIIHIRIGYTTQISDLFKKLTAFYVCVGVLK